MSFSTAQLISTLAQYPRPDRYVIAFSGGLDSTVLLEAMALCRETLQINLSAVHINHGLQKQSHDWQKHCQSVCERLHIPLTCIAVNVDQQSGKGIEAAAREARYQAFASIIESDDILCLAHHEDDQAETLLLQLLRGAGVAGLAAMPMNKVFARGQFLRPLLQHTRNELLLFAQQHALQWIEDPSNEHTTFDRNYLRHEVMPVLKQRWPATDASLARSAAHLAEANSVLKEVAEQDWQVVAGETADRLSLQALTLLSTARARNVVRYWIHHINHAPLPDTKRLQQIFDEVIMAAEDGEPCVQWSGRAVRRYRHYLYMTEALISRPVGRQWDLRQSLHLPEMNAYLITHTIESNGLRTDLVGRSDVQIRFRRGGESCRPVGRGEQHHELKKLMQEWGVPPWQRERIPLLYVQDEIAAVIGFCICEGYAADHQTQGIGIKIEDLSSHGIARKDENNDNSQD